MANVHAQRAIYQTLLEEGGGDFERALQMAAARIELLINLSSFAYGRRMSTPTSGSIDDVPNPIEDSWIRTGRES